MQATQANERLLARRGSQSHGFSPHALWEKPATVSRTLKQLSEETHMERTGGLLPTASPGFQQCPSVIKQTDSLTPVKLPDSVLTRPPEFRH